MLEQPPASVPDFSALRSCWHPIAFAEELAGDPRRVRLLGEDLVAWRDSKGRPHVLRDLCIHRGTALSLGRVVGDRLMCPYHGWQYGSDGVCKAIPQLEDPTRVPGKARVDAFRCEERLGLLWVAMDEPRWDLPDIPEFDDSGWTLVQAGPYGATPPLTLSGSAGGVEGGNCVERGPPQAAVGMAVRKGSPVRRTAFATTSRRRATAIRMTFPGFPASFILRTKSARKPGWRSSLSAAM